MLLVVEGLNRFGNAPYSTVCTSTVLGPRVQNWCQSYNGLRQPFQATVMVGVTTSHLEYLRARGLRLEGLGRQVTWNLCGLEDLGTAIGALPAFGGAGSSSAFSCFSPTPPPSVSSAPSGGA